jgi:hypothetical protein
MALTPNVLRWLDCEIFVLPVNLDELYPLDERHLVSVDHDGAMSVVESIGTVPVIEVVLTYDLPGDMRCQE